MLLKIFKFTKPRIARHLADDSPLLALSTQARTAGLLLVVIGFFACSAPSATAHTYRHQLQISAKSTSNLFIESQDGKAILEETGGLMYLRAHYRNTFANNIFFGLDLEKTSGRLNWDGRGQGGFRYSTKTEYYISSYRFFLGRQNPKYATHFGLAQRYRERNVLTQQIGEDEIPGLYEELRWWDLFGNFELYPYRTKVKHLKIYSELSASISGDLRAEFNGRFDPASVKAGRLLAFEAGFEYFVELKPNWAIAIKPSYRYTYMDNSKAQDLLQDGQASGASFSQPVTEYQEFGIEIGLSRSLEGLFAR